MQEIKILNYNILHGFHRSVSPFNLEQERVDKVRKIVAKENPDILVLTEACYGGPNPFNIIIDYQKLFGFPYGYFGKWGDYEWGNFLLSKYPVKARTVPYGERTAVKSSIDINGKTIYLDIIHPFPDLSEDEKIKITKPLLRGIKKPYFLIGDFNAISDEDSYDRSLLIEGFGKFDKTPVQTVDRLLGRKFIPWLRSQDLKDTSLIESRRPTIPTDLLSKDKSSSMRIDYILSSPDIETLETRVIKNKDTDFASDHYPIVGRFKIK